MLVGTACDSERSSNPLSPQIAGPLAGVTITSPASALPNGQLSAASSQPFSLVFLSATSNSVRPFTYEIQIATDEAFTQIVFTQRDIQPTSDDQFTYQVPVTLDAGVYYWRVRALDGANTGPYSTAASFELYIPVVIQAPTVVGPTGGQATPDNDTTLVVQNAVITGPAATIRYQFELSTVPGFVPLSSLLTVPQGPGTSTTVGAGELPSDQVFYWRARVTAQSRIGEVVGPWSTTASFRTPVPPVVIAEPIPSSPINGATTPSVRPILTVTNGSVTGAAGTVTYRFEIAESSSFAPLTTVTTVVRSSGATTSATPTVDLAPDRTFYWRVNASNGTVTSSYSATQTFRTPSVQSPPPSSPPTPGGRTPDPPQGQLLPVPNMASTVFEVASQFPAALANSCQDAGGTWEFLDRLVDRLREFDTRWGYNCKRGNCGDPSKDVMAYHAGAGPEVEGALETRTVDVIAGHCGPNPGASWTVQDYGTGSDAARWTSRGRF